MKTSKEAWNKIYNIASETVKKYEVLNVPFTETNIYIYYIPKGGFYTQKDFDSMKKLCVELEEAFESEKNSGLIEMNISEDFSEKRITITRK
jgi:hypothetical protein